MCDLRERALKSQPKMPWYRMRLLPSSELILSATSHGEKCYRHDTRLLETRQSLHVYICAYRTRIYMYTLINTQAHASGTCLCLKNWSVMPSCSSGPSRLLVSGRPKAFKCFKLIITLMLSPPPVISVFVCKKMKCNWNRRKDGGAQTF